jgi:phosphomannomutase
MWNGMNLARSQAVGISRGTGMEKIEKLAFAIEKKEVMGSAISERKQERTVYEKTDVIPAYFQFLKKIHPLTIKKRFAVVADGNHGASAELFQKFVKASKLPITVFPLRANLDGTLPQGEPNPLHVENHKPLLVEVKKKKADFGIAWDADGDRVFFVDEKGVFIPTYYASAAIIESMLKNQHHKKTERQKPTILVDTRQYWLTRDITKENGGKWAFTKPGMTVVASAMKKKKAIFGSETSAHYYFQKTFNRDNGFVPILYVLELLDQKKCALSELMAPFFKTYAISQEINFTFPGSTDPKKILSAIEKKYQRGKISHFEGLMVEFDSWRFSVRSSNTERLIRLNVEAVSEKILKEELGKIKNVISWLR